MYIIHFCFPAVMEERKAGVQWITIFYKRTEFKFRTIAMLLFHMIKKSQHISRHYIGEIEGPCHSKGGQALASHCGGRSQVTWESRWMDKAALGNVFSEYFGFPCQSFHRLLHTHHHHHPSTGAGTMGKIVADVETGCDGIDWIGVAQDRDQWRAVVSAVMNFHDPYNAGKFLSGCTTGGLSSSAQLHRVSGRRTPRYRRKN
jgi:hypothetical protein